MGIARTLAFSLLFSALALAQINSCYAQNSPQDYIVSHNSARDSVGVGGINWDDSLATYAQNYANQRAGDCNLVHSGGPYGENLFWGFGKEYTAADAVGSWVNEIQFYDYNSNTCQPGQQCGHYTQVVWRSSLNVGCARVQCNNGAWFISCNYSPPGNFVGQHPY